MNKGRTLELFKYPKILWKVNNNQSDILNDK